MMNIINKPIIWSKPRKAPPTGIILHGTAGASALSSISWLNLFTKNSYNYVIEDNGDVYKCVAASRAASHAGKSTGWAGKWCNSYTIGVAFANIENGREPITIKQMDALYLLLEALKVQFPTLLYIARHKDVSPGRKFDPIMISWAGLQHIASSADLVAWK